MAFTGCHVTAMAWVRMLPGRPAPPRSGRTLLKGTLIRLRRERRYLVMPVCSGRVIQARRATTNPSVKSRRMGLSICANRNPGKTRSSAEAIPPCPKLFMEYHLRLLWYSDPLFDAKKWKCCEKMCEEAGVPPTTDEGPNTTRPFGPLIRYFPEYNKDVTGSAHYKKKGGCCPSVVK